MASMDATRRDNPMARPKVLSSCRSLCGCPRGGAWRACLKSDNVEDVVLWQSGRYLVVTPPEHLEFTFAWETPNHEDGPGVQTHVIVRLEELANGGTRMHFSQTGFLSIKSAISHSAGWNGTFDRLAEFLLDEIVSQPPICRRLKLLLRSFHYQTEVPVARCA